MSENGLEAYIAALLERPLPEAGQARLEELLGLGDSEAAARNVALGLAAGLIGKALTGDVSAFREVRTVLSAAEAPAEERFELPARMIAPAFAPVYFDLLAGGHREYVLYGGRGSTKSAFVSLMVLEQLYRNPEIHALICRQVKDTLRDSVFAQMQWAIEKLALKEQFESHVSPLEITRRATGQKILFRGADDPAKLKSIKTPFGYLGVLWFEELDQFGGAEQVRNIEQSVLRGGEGALIFKSFNPPRTKNNWANRYLQTPKEGRLCHHSTYETVPPAWLGKTFLEEAAFLKETDPAAYAHEYLGEANSAGGLVFENLTLREILPEELAEFDHIYMGLDWGYYPDPFAWVKVHYDPARRRLFLLDELVCTKCTNAETGQRLREEKGVTGADRILADSAEPKSIGDYRQQGFLCRRAKKGPGSVETSTRWLQSLAEIVIDPARCPAAAAEFAGYEYERDGEDNVISRYPDRDNHTIDAVRYALSEVWSRRGE